MSKVHANLYYFQIEQQFNEAKEILQDVTEFYNSGDLPEENMAQALKDFEDAKLVYETARIMISLLNKPSDKNYKKLDKTAKDWYDSMTSKAKEGIYNENVNILQDMMRLKKGE